MLHYNCLMDNTVTLMDLVCLAACGFSALVAIASAFFCYTKNKEHDASQATIATALSAVNNAVLACGQRAEECEDAYLNLVRSVYRLEKSVGAIAGGVIGVGPDGEIDAFGEDDDV